MPAPSQKSFYHDSDDEDPTESEHEDDGDANRDADEEDDDNDEELLQTMTTKAKATRTRKTIAGAKKNTRIRSLGRAPILPHIASLPNRPVICQKCAGELSQFPDLRCIENPSSPARKCFECQKKGKECKEVSDSFPFGEAPANSRARFQRRSKLSFVT
jgi:hypothetical protein